MRTGILILKGEIELLSPTLIGSGESEETQIDFLVDNEGEPYIPASSLIGVLRSYIHSGSIDKKNLLKFWGSVEENEECQSLVSCKDLTLLEGHKATLETRFGVSIDGKSGTAKEGALFDYQLIEPGTKFRLNMEIALNNNVDPNFKNFLRKMLATIQKVLFFGEISVGAMTNNGFGRISLSESEIYELNFKNKEHVKAWLTKNFDIIPPLNKEITPFDIERNEFHISASFVLRNSFISCVALAEHATPDYESIKSNGQYIIPGPSLKGVLRHRAMRIAKTIELQQAEEFIKELFGYVETERKENEKDSQKGKLSVEEIKLNNYTPEIQHRIKVDRFTGGTISGALFNSMPVYHGRNGNDKEFKLNLRIKNYTDAEAGILLLLLKDLWTGDLPVGGEKSIGRGRLSGLKAEIKWEDRKIIIENNKDVSEKDRQILNSFIECLTGGHAIEQRTS